MLTLTSKYALISHMNNKSNISESFRALRTNIQYSVINQKVQTILITSSQPLEGKTTAVSNLAIVYAQEGKKVLLIDADMRQPSLHNIFGKLNHKGLSTLLSEQNELKDVLNETHIDNLSIITSGPIPPNPSELLASRQMNTLLKELGEAFDVILLDSPSALQVTDPQILAAQCDGVVLVIRSGKVRRHHVKKVLATLEYVNARILGTVLNHKG